MKYADDLDGGYVNGYYVGKSLGAKTHDGADPDNDGFENIRSFTHIGTVVQDGANPNYPQPPALDAPSGLKASEVTSTSVKLTWN